MSERRDDMAKLAQGALSVAAGMAEEMRAMAKAGTDALTQRMELVRREEFDAMAELARRTAERLESLEARLAALEAEAAPRIAAQAALDANAGSTRGGEGSN